MFLQILEWLTTFVSLLNDHEKLSSERNRKQIGKSVVQLHSVLTRVVTTAMQIRSELAAILKRIQRNESRSYRYLIQLLGEQRQSLAELQKVLVDQRELINVYGEHCGEVIHQATGGKTSLIDVITYYALFATVDWWIYEPPLPECLPKTFDLMQIHEFKAKVEGRPWSDFQNLLASSESLSPEHGCGIPDVFVNEMGKDAARDEELVRYLLAQIDEMGSIERLTHARDTVAEMLRTHFRIEEIF